MRIKLFFLLLGCLCILSTPALAATAIMIGDDANNAASTSFNSDVQLKWSPAGAPTAGNTYSTGGWLMRTPTTYGNYTFAGDALTVGGPSPHYPFLTNGSVNNNSLICKTPDSAGVAPIITVPNLIVDAGYVRDGNGTANVWTIAGNMFITANGGGFANQCRMNVASVMSGSGLLYVADNGSGDANRATYIDSPLNTYSGSIDMLGQTSVRSRLTFIDDSLMNFDIGASGVNNKIYGTGTLTLDGDFNFNLGGASANLGDSWTITSVTSQTYDPTFTVKNFVDAGGDLWTKAIDGVKYYQFSEATGILSVVVPEPATWIMLVLGAMGIALYSRKK